MIPHTDSDNSANTAESRAAYSIDSFIAEAYLAQDDTAQSSRLPVSDFPRNSQARLVWAGTGVETYNLYDGIGNLIYTGAGQPTLVKIATDTTYVLEAINKAGHKLYSSLTLTVSNPAYDDLFIVDSTTLGKTGVTGSVTINSAVESNAGLTVDGGLSVTGGATISETLSIKESTKITGTMNVTDTTTLAETSVGAISVSEAVTLQNTLVVADETTLATTTVNGDLTVTGNTSLVYTANMFSCYQYVGGKDFSGTGTYTFNGNISADSLVVLYFDSSTIATGDVCQITLIYDSTYFYILYDQHKSNTNFFTIPIPLNQKAKNSSGNPFQLTADYQSGDGNLEFRCFTVQLGVNAPVSIKTPPKNT